MQCALFDDILCLSGGIHGGIFAVDPASGKQLWKQLEIKDMAYLKADQKRGLLFCDCGLGDLVVVDAFTGVIIGGKKKFGHCFTRAGSKFLLGSDRSKIRVTSWPDMTEYGSLASRAFALLDAEFTDNNLIYSEVATGITFVKVDCRAPLANIEGRFLIEGHYDELGFWRSKNLFVGVDVTDDPHRLVMIDAEVGRVVEVRDAWKTQGFFISSGSRILTRTGQVVSLEDESIVADDIFG